MTRSICWIRTAIVFTFIVASAQTQASPQTFTEDFTTTTYLDEINTTADWNTAAGELKLPQLPVLIGGCDTPGQANNIALSGDYAFVADLDDGLQVILFHDHMNPELYGSCDTPGSARDVAVSGYHVFVADDASGLQVIDVSNRIAPSLAGSCDTPGLAYGVAVSGYHAFVADNSSGLQVIDISDPANPVPVGSCDTPGLAFGVAISGDLALVADGFEGLQVIDISDPANPTLLGTCDTPWLAYDVTVSGDHAFVADYTDGLRVIDIGDPTAPVLVGGCNTLDSARGVAVSGDLAFVADNAGGLQVIDIGNPAAPVLVGGCDTPGYALGVAVSGGTVLIADYENGLQVAKVGDPASPAVTGLCYTPGHAYGLALSGDHAFLANGAYGLQVVDIADPAVPALVGACDTPGDAMGVAVSGDHAFVADYNFGLQVIDISDPAFPVLRSSCDTPDSALAVAVSGDYAFVADGLSGLQILDISDLDNPVYAGSYDTPGEACDVVISGVHAYVPDRAGGLQVIDVSDPANPVLADAYATNGDAYGVAVLLDLAYVAFLGQYGLDVLDIRYPTHLSQYTNGATGDLSLDVAVSDDQVFVADSMYGLLAYDIGNFGMPDFVENLFLSSGLNSVEVSGDYVYGTGYEGSLYVMQVSQHDLASTLNAGRSLAVDGSDDIIPRARLSSVQTGDVAWELSTDGGLGWTPVSPDNSWTRIAAPGADLLWRTTHTWPPDPNPTVSELTLEWLNEFAPIVSVSDVPDDQGGAVRVAITRSGYDFADEPQKPVTGYQIYQRIDEPEAVRLARGLQAGLDADAVDLHVSPLEGLEMWNVGDRVFARSVDKAVAFPAGTWEAVGWVAASQSDGYVARVGTVADSSAAATNWSVYLVTTHTTTPSIWFASLPDSGYSVDNLVPNAPEGLMVAYAAGGNELAWLESEDADFRYFKVYRGATPDFAVDPENPAQVTTSTSWTDPTGGFDVFYKVSAVDFAGNESLAAAPGELTGVGGPPTAFRLLGAAPNPFNPKTTIRFALPDARAVDLRVYDASGRLVRTLLDGETRPAGRQGAEWDGRDGAGRTAPSGVYFYRLIAGEDADLGRMLLLK